MAQKSSQAPQAGKPELMRERTILQRFPVSKSHWRAGVLAGKFPRGIKISERIMMWRAADIDKFLNDLAAV